MSAPAFRAKLGETTEASATAGTDTTISITVAAGDDLLIFSGFKDSGDTNQTTSTVVFNTTESATKLGESNNTGGSTTARSVSAWRLLNPTATTANIVATYSEAVQSAWLVVFAYTGVDDFGAVSAGDVNTANNTSAEAHISIATDLTTTRANSLGVCAIICQDGGRDPFTPDAGTERSDGATGANATNDISFTVIERAAPTVTNYAFGTTTSGTGTPTGAACIAVEIRSAVAGNPWYFYSQQ